MLDTVHASVDSGRREILAVVGSPSTRVGITVAHNGLMALRETRRHGLVERVSPTAGRSRRSQEPQPP